MRKKRAAERRARAAGISPPSAPPSTGSQSQEASAPPNSEQMQGAVSAAAAFEPVHVPLQMPMSSAAGAASAIDGQPGYDLNYLPIRSRDGASFAGGAHIPDDAYSAGATYPFVTHRAAPTGTIQAQEDGVERTNRTSQARAESRTSGPGRPVVMHRAAPTAEQDETVDVTLVELQLSFPHEALQSSAPSDDGGLSPLAGLDASAYARGASSPVLIRQSTRRDTNCSLPSFPHDDAHLLGCVPTPGAVAALGDAPGAALPSESANTAHDSTLLIASPTHYALPVPLDATTQARHSLHQHDSLRTSGTAAGTARSDEAEELERSPPHADPRALSWVTHEVAAYRMPARTRDNS